MKKWIIGIVIGLVVVLAAAEMIRRSASDGESAAGIGETGNGSAVVDHLKGDKWERDAKATSTDGSVEFEQAERITDSREEDLDKAKGKVDVFVKNIKGE